MIYAYIYQWQTENENWQPNFFIDFYWSKSSKEEQIWEDIISEHIRLWIKWVYTKKETLIKHLAERNFTPSGDNLFYKKSFLEKFF